MSVRSLTIVFLFTLAASVRAQHVQGLLDEAGGRIEIPGVASLTVEANQISEPLQALLEVAPVRDVAGLIAGERAVRSVRLTLRRANGPGKRGARVCGIGWLAIEGGPTVPGAAASIVRSGQAPDPRGNVLPAADGFMPGGGLDKTGETTAEVPLITGLKEPDTFTLIDGTHSRELSLEFETIFVGNPKVGKDVFSEDPGAGIALPIRVNVYKNVDGGTIVRYVPPSHLLRDFHNPKIRMVAKMLDEKLEKMIAMLPQ